MDFDLIINGAFLAFFSLFTAVFLLQRLRYRRKKSVNPNHRGFYPSAAALALTLLSLQTIAQPGLNHSLEQRQTEAAQEEENGDPNDPAAQLNRQLKRIRNGQPVDALKVPLRKTWIGLCLCFAFLVVIPEVDLLSYLPLGLSGTSVAR